MAAKTKEQAYGSSPSKQPEHLPVSLQKSRRSATTRPRPSKKICCSSTERRSGATVGDVTPGYPRGGPKCTRPNRVGRADGIPADSIRTVHRVRLQEASSGVGIDPIFLVQLEI